MNKIGLIARADNTGLGIQTHEFYKHIKPEKTLVVDVSKLNGLPIYLHRYPGCKVVTDQMTVQDINEFLTGIDVLFCCETPYNKDMFRIARNKGIKTIMQYNYEFLDMKLFDKIYWPDVFAAPSMWHFEDCKKQFKNVVYLPVPVNRALLPFKQKTKYRRFLHIVGNSAIHDRNATQAVIAAFIKLNNPELELVIKCFNKTAANQFNVSGISNITLDTSNTTNYEHNYAGFDALILPRKYGGLCLPMQEALSCGMPVIMTATEPNTIIIPEQWLVGISRTFNFEATYTINVNEPDIQDLSDTIKWLSGLDEQAAIAQSNVANEIANELDWKIWEKKYRELLNA